MHNNTLAPGTTLHAGSYRIVKFIAAGGFGCTYEAIHVALGRRLAIKEFFPQSLCNRDATNQISVGTHAQGPLVEKLKKKFIDEARSVAALDHPNIVRVSDVFEENGTAYFVMDYVDGESLSDKVKRNGPLSEADAVRYICQVADALSYVHSRNRLHLDIKPGNIMVNGKDNAVLIDFGASKQYDEESGENTSTLTGRTPGYAPLEQVNNRKLITFTPATDIYALGATLYKLLSGVTPPDASDISSGIDELQPLPAHVSASTRRAVEAAMQQRIKDRPQTIDEWLPILNRVYVNHQKTANDSTQYTDEPTIPVTLAPEKSLKVGQTLASGVTRVGTKVMTYQDNEEDSTSEDKIKLWRLSWIFSMLPFMFYFLRYLELRDYEVIFFTGYFMLSSASFFMFFKPTKLNELFQEIKLPFILLILSILIGFIYCSSTFFDDFNLCAAVFNVYSILYAFFSFKLQYKHSNLIRPIVFFLIFINILAFLGDIGNFGKIEIFVSMGKYFTLPFLYLLMPFMFCNPSRLRNLYSNIRIKLRKL